MKTQSISLCMIVKNEEKLLANCLKSVKGVVDEIIIVDTGSTDSTITIAKEYTDTVFSYTWNNNFSDARNESIKYATSDWILILDADEELGKCDKESITSFLRENNHFGAFLLPINNIMDNDRVIHSSTIRIFKNSPAIRFSGSIHEEVGYDIVENGIKVSTFPIEATHYGYKELIVSEKDKRTRNMGILREQLSVDENNGFAWFNLGTEYISLVDYNNALSCYKKALEVGNYEGGYVSQCIRCIADICIDTNNYDEGFIFIKKGISMFPDYTDLYYLLASLLVNTGRHEESINWFKKCTELGEAPLIYSKIDGISTFRSLYGIAFAYEKLGKYRESVIYAVGALKVNPKYVECLELLVNIMLKEAQKSTVLEFVGKLVDLSDERVATTIKTAGLT